MSILSTLRIAASALTAQRLRMDVIASNVAHADTTRTSEGGPYRRMRVVFSSMNPYPRPLDQMGGLRLAAMDRRISSVPENGGVAVAAIVPDPTPPRLVYEPGHPDADDQGYVAYPNVDLATEMVDMLSATRAYEANITVINAAKGMALKALEIGRG